MSKKRGGAAVADSPVDPPKLPEVVDDLEPTELIENDQIPVQGPILEPEEIEHYERIHYGEIRELNSAVKVLEDRADCAKRSAKMAKDSLEEGHAQLTELISRGPQIPGRKYAKRVRLIKAVRADTELGRGFLTIEPGEEFDVQDIEGNTVAVLVQGITNYLGLGEFAVIEWSSSPPHAADKVKPKTPKRIKMLVEVGNDVEGTGAVGSEWDAIVDADGDVAILLSDDSNPYPLEPEEFEVIEWSEPVDPNGWKSVPLSEVLTGQAKKAVKILAGEKIETFGQFIDWQRDRNELRNVEGIGPELEGFVGDACADFFAKNPHYAEAINAGQ